MHLVLNELALISVRCSVPSQRLLPHANHRALAGYQKALGPDHTSTLNTVNNLRNLYSDQGKLKKAEEMY
ncbi:hypothetical protein N7499_001813 [Penicillium canescens]|nr:hypothetical protein N7522_007547 [Penicillium canescens]KAJ6097439.1 hypothetical protein N7499_001813 [Penicillium canescens]